VTQSSDPGDHGEIERLREENALLWRAFELSLGDPYQGQVGSPGRWMSELASAQEALRDAMCRREETGVSVWSGHRRLRPR
jgi:hypothetical protein